MRANYLISLEQKILNNQELVFMNRERLSTIRLPSHKRSFVKSVLATMRERGAEGRRPAKAPLVETVSVSGQIEQTAQDTDNIQLREDGLEPVEAIEIHRRVGIEASSQERLGKSAVGSVIDRSAEAAA